jgi:hypothetical protein
MFERSWDALRLRDKHQPKKLFVFLQTTPPPGFNDWVNEPSGLPTELKITSQVVSFIQYVFLFHVYSSVVSFFFKWWTKSINMTPSSATHHNQNPLELRSWLLRRTHLNQQSSFQKHLASIPTTATNIKGPSW